MSEQRNRIRAIVKMKEVIVNLSLMEADGGENQKEIHGIAEAINILEGKR